MVEFFKTWSHLPDEQKNLIHAHRIDESGEWYIDINGIKILMRNKSAEAEASGISIKEVLGHGKQTYFSFRKEGYTPGRRRPKNEEWEKMASTAGGWGNLRELLQIPLISYIPGITDDDWEEMKELVGIMTCMGTAEVWSGIMFASDDADINTHIGMDALQPVRLLIE
jgi:hypothetical protein